MAEPNIDEYEIKRRKRRRRIVYGSAGGAAASAIIWAYIFIFVGFTIAERSVKRFQAKYPESQLRRGASGYVTTIINLERNTARSGDGIDPERVAVDFVREPTVAATLDVPEAATLRVTAAYDDPQRTDHRIVRVQQYLEGIPVFGADIALSVRTGPNAAVSSVANRPTTLPAVTLTPAIDEPRARAAALAFYAGAAADATRGLKPGASVDEVDRIVFDPKRFRLGGEATLAWRVRISSLETIVDAQRGQVLAAYDDRLAALNRLTNDCANTTTCALVLKETEVVGKPPINGDATFAHDAARIAYEYFKDKFKRDGFDAIESDVRVPNLQNALWDGSSKRFQYGAGWTTLDIAAHEFTHAVTQFGPRLGYVGEVGSVNEFFSDFFGVMVVRWKTGTLDWRIGENVSGFSMAHPVRNMADPHMNVFDPKQPFSNTNNGQPELYKELVTLDDPICATTRGGDNVCVHFNSGILNKALWLAGTGGQFQGTTVTPVSIDKLEQIMFRTLMAGITASSGLEETADGAVASCAALIPSTYQIAASDCTALEQAFKAVGLRQ